MRTILTIIAVVVVLVLGKIFFFKKSDDKAAGGPGAGAAGGSGSAPATAVNIFITSFSTLDNAVTSSGTVFPNEEVQLMPEATGRIVALNIKEGSRVAAGQVIAKIKDTDLQAQLKKINYQIELAKQTDARQKKLLEINAISREEYEITSNTLNTLDADKEFLETSIEKTVLKAPFSGKISFKNVSQGAFVTSATSLATLVQTNPVKIDFTVPEKYSTQIRLGSQIKFEVEGQANSYSANITAIDPKIDPNLRTLKVRAVAQNPNDRLIPGMFVKVTLDLDISQAIMIPTEAIIPVLKGKKVYVMQDGKVAEKMVETGLRNEKNIQILSGLVAGDSLIVSGIMSIKKGVPVKAKEVIK